jgi:hypothetical protein
MLGATSNETNRKVKGPLRPLQDRHKWSSHHVVLPVNIQTISHVLWGILLGVQILHFSYQLLAFIE